MSSPSRNEPGWLRLVTLCLMALTLCLTVTPFDVLISRTGGLLNRTGQRYARWLTGVMLNWAADLNHWSDQHGG